MTVPPWPKSAIEGLDCCRRGLKRCVFKGQNCTLKWAKCVRLREQNCVLKWTKCARLREQNVPLFSPYVPSFLVCVLSGATRRVAFMPIDVIISLPTLRPTP